MAEQFYTILTNTGKAKIANSLPTGTKVNLTTLKVGDSNGTYYNPSETQTDLVHTVYTCNVTSVAVDTTNGNWINITAVIPSDQGGFTIREVGVFDDSGNLIAIGKYPETYKPTASDGSTKELYLKMTLEVSNSSSVTLKIDPTVILATKSDINTLTTSMNNSISTINSQLSEKMNKKDNYFITPDMIEIVDDTEKLQSLFDEGIVKGKVVFPRDGIYNITKTLYIHEGLDVDFNGCRIKVLDGQYTNNFALLIGTPDGVNSSGRTRMDYSTIRKLDIYNQTSNEITAICLGNGGVISSIKTENFYGSIAFTPSYIDYVHITDVQIVNHKGTKYAISKGGNGDSVKINGIHMFSTENINSVEVIGSQGCEINGLLNGNIKLTKCTGTKISTCHLEYGSIFIQDSSVTIENNFIWKRGAECITITDSDGATLNYKGRNITLSNNNFILKYDRETYENEIHDIKLNTYKNSLVLNNNCRQVESSGDNYIYSYTCGISCVDENNNIILIDKPSCRLIRGTKVEDKVVNSNITYGDDGYGFFNSVTPSVVGVPYKSDDIGTSYSYCLGLIYPNDRLIGLIHKDVIKVTTTSNNSMRLFLNPSRFGLDGCIRIYKGTTNRNYNQYVDVPIPLSSSLVDNGYSVNGYKWKDRTNGEIDTINKCYGYYALGNNYFVVSNSIPTVGTWKVGDRVFNSSPVVGSPKSWVCTVAGTPGTWVSEGNL